jgi:hypothetical protein
LILILPSFFTQQQVQRTLQGNNHTFKMMRFFRLASTASILSVSCKAFSPMSSTNSLQSNYGSVELAPSTLLLPSQKSKTALNLAGAQEAWTAYTEALEASPLIVKSVTASVILGAADLAGQALQAATSDSEEAASVDIARTARFAFFGLVLQAPWNHFYYNMLDGTIPPTVEPWTATTGIKVAIDQFVQAPIFTVLIFAFLGFLEGKSLEAVKKQLDEDYADTMVANCKFFVFVFATIYTIHIDTFGLPFCFSHSDYFF